VVVRYGDTMVLGDRRGVNSVRPGPNRFMPLTVTIWKKTSEAGRIPRG